MKRKNHRSGQIRFFIVLIIAAVLLVVVIRLAAGCSSTQSETETEGISAGLGGTESAVAATSAAAGEEGNGQAGAVAGEAGGRTVGEDSAGLSTQAAAADASIRKQTELEKGKEYLDSLDERSPIEIEYQIDRARVEYEKEKQRKEYIAQREKYRSTLEKENVWEKFDDYAFLGDSRVVGFDVFGFLPSERVLAEAGDTILRVSDRMDALKELDPDLIFISYGINDVGIGFWPTAEEYGEAFGEMIDELRKEFPDAKIFVNSIIPATDEAVSERSVWGGIPEYSEAVRRTCEEKGITFIDNTDLIEEHSDMYAGDGIHLQSMFYPYWAQEQLLAVFDLEQGRTADGYLLNEKEPEEMRR